MVPEHEKKKRLGEKPIKKGGRHKNGKGKN